jgi:hypothetical protein
MGFASLNEFPAWEFNSAPGYARPARPETTRRAFFWSGRDRLIGATKGRLRCEDERGNAAAFEKTSEKCSGSARDGRS